ncbi:predicted protein [Postia placenta Mad-698-R]|uniref:HAT C-terminal dimerisation domain-containing protein n=1 Tax=Postia placenta MAD-698-R-SB12 TaxID=670580 RepID=A0A1X6MJ38_9APHY|nr:hypothetical protein POSPLADRAFT_1050610 [Postia placenta MAD-698-R-SB12]EED80198.1 predicted protein [Postia placenta Mad-698-R]OSX56380.1 hypothetical protein POSPLADRAFT_1050610 [Postia placenta MAD-698-R-SB12]
MANEPKFTPVKLAIEKGLAKIEKWYKAVSQLEIYFICLALDPTIKLEYAKNSWSDEQFSKSYKALEDVFNEYVKTTPDAGAEESNTPVPDLPKTKKGYGTKWIQDAVRKRVENERKTHNPCKKLKKYVDGHLEVDIDLVKWWGNQTGQYPTLSHIARDYLTIQGSAVSSERVFLSGGRTGTKDRNQLAPATFEALQIVKDAYRTGVLNTKHNV